MRKEKRGNELIGGYIYCREMARSRTSGMDGSKDQIVTAISVALAQSGEVTEKDG